jgi:hypothetical protein
MAAEDIETVWVFNKACGTRMRINARDFNAAEHTTEDPSKKKVKSAKADKGGSDGEGDDKPKREKL